MIGRLVTEIQSLGVRLGAGVLRREGGAGPADAGMLIIHDHPVSVPTHSPFVSDSPYSLADQEGRLFLCKDGSPFLPVEPIPRPRFYDRTTQEGTPCFKIALLHGKDCLATSVLQTCAYWNEKVRCRFCGIELSLRSGQTIPRKSPEQLVETARLAKALDGVSHVVLTTGSPQPPGAEIGILGRASLAIKEATGLPVHAQFLPPPDLESLWDLKRCGVDTVGIHIESLDRDILSAVAPVKAAIGPARYEAAWRAAVEIFGPNQVSSFLIAGLGERPDSVLCGCERLADLGVYPFVVPLRPIPGSLMADERPPDPGIMMEIYEKAARIVEAGGLSASQSKAGCVRCGACSALPFFERAEPGLACHPARTSDEREQAFAVREEVFVGEQKIFETTDRDVYDAPSIHLVVKKGPEVVGTVRVFRNGQGGDHWIGGRLAVKKGYRASGVGELLVRKAVKTVKERGATRFTAHIQAENVPFFLRLGWRTIGSPALYCGRVHQVMEASLTDEPQFPEKGTNDSL